VLSLAQSKVNGMENRYWIARKRAAMAMARAAKTGEAKLIHYELAGRYSVKAAQYPPAFALPATKAAAAEGARPALHLPLTLRAGGTGS
jgi:hypothetical protein